MSSGYLLTPFEALLIWPIITTIFHPSPFTLSPFTLHLSPFTFHLSPFTFDLSPFHPYPLIGFCYSEFRMGLNSLWSTFNRTDRLSPLTTIPQSFTLHLIRHLRSDRSSFTLDHHTTIFPPLHPFTFHPSPFTFHSSPFAFHHSPFSPFTLHL